MSKNQRTIGLAVALALAPSLACGADDENGQLTSDTDSYVSGFTTGPATAGPGGPETSAGTLSTTGATGGTTGESTSGASDPTAGVTSDPGTSTTLGTTGNQDTTDTDYPLGEGDLRGLLTFTRIAADSLNDSDIVGLAGAWRTVANELTEVEDFFGVWGLETPFPIPPSAPDTLQHDGLLGGFDWGLPPQWRLAGNAMKLEAEGAEAQACLLFLGSPPFVTFAGMPDVPNYPIYAATNSTQQPEGCAPSAMQWAGGTAYDLVLYGGDLFPTNVLPARVHTPPTFEVTAPDISIFQSPLPSAADLTISWTANGSPGNRIVIRLRDMFGRMLTVNAADDGTFTIPAADLQELDAGPLTLMIARENLELVLFTEGTIKVLSRYEQRGYFDLD